LPTEAEWEYTAKSGDDFDYSGGNVLDDISWCNGNSKNKSHPVGQKKSNSFGIFDMTGNVWEWCQDSYDPYYFIQCQEKGMVEDPVCSGSDKHVLRGGAWNSGSVECAILLRWDKDSSFKWNNTGIRLVKR